MFRSRVDSVFTLTLMMLYLGVIGECPPGCVCMWKSGKESTECINQSKSSIPTGIEPSTQVLNIRGNSIKVFEDNIFLQLGITNLQKIFCSYCSVREIQPRAFRRLTNLIELDLSENALKEIPTESWKYTKALMKLNLSGNPIKLIRAGAFKRLTFVTNLYLAHCEIETIEAEAFTSLEALLELKLENNRLNYIQGAGLFPRSLHHIEIHGNPFHCDCRLLDFVSWIQGSGIPRSVEPLCFRPLRLENASVSSLSLGELACLPQVEPAVLKTVVVQGSTNVTLRCSVFGIPRAIVSWWHANRLVANGTNLDHPWERQYYLVKEIKVNQHKLISEIVIFEIRPEDNGFFYCSASNPAGVVRANFTLQVLTKSNIDPQGKTTKDVSLDVSSINSQTEENSETVVEMLKVEYILGFGAAAVVVLTIIIIMILYLVLQCRSRRYKSRLSRALHCDSNSNSNSYIERSTVDFIVPGEMELTSAVRSVSCSSVLSKCNGNKDGQNNNSNNNSNNNNNMTDDDDDEDRDKDEDEYGGRKRRTPRAVRHSSLSDRTHYLDGPPSYKHPPPPVSRSEPLCRCCGEPQWRHPTAANMGFIPPRFVTPYQEAQHIRDCPRNQMHMQHSRGEWNCGNYPPPSQNYFDSSNHTMYNTPNGDVMNRESPVQNMRYRSNSLRNPKKYNNPYISRPYVYPGMHNSNNNLHYVTMSRGMPGYPRTDLIRYATSQPHLNGNYPQPRSINSMHPNHQNILTPMSLETSITLPRSSPNTTISTPRYPYLPRQPPRYNMNNSYANQHKPNLPHHHQSNHMENGDISRLPNMVYDRNEQKKQEDYLFPDLPPPPDASLPIIKNGSRSSSLDDLSSDSRGHDNSQRPFYTLPNHPGFSVNNNNNNSASRRRSSYKNRNSSSMNNSSPNNNNNNNNMSESVVRIDLSGADKTIRRPGSAPDLVLPTMAASPVRSVLRSNRQGTLECSASIDRRSIIINPSTKGTNKKVMFTGVSDEGEENSNSSAQDIIPVEEDPVWVLRTDKTEEHPLSKTDSRLLSNNLDNDVPITGIIIAQPNKYVVAGYPASVMPPKIIPNPLNSLSVNSMSIQQMSLHPHHSSSESSSGTVSNIPRPNIGRGSLTLGSSAGSSSSVTSVATPPMMNPQQQPLLQHQQHQQQMQGLRPGNPALQRPIQPHFHESPDEGYHEEDGGSETL